MSQVTWGEAIAQAEESGDGKPVADGEYNVRVDSAKSEPSKAGNPMITLILKVTDDGAAKNGTIWERLTLTSKSAGIFFRSLSAYGITTEDVKRLPEPNEGGMAQLAGLLKERTARVKIKNDDYGPKVDRYLGKAVPTSGPAPATAVGGPATLNTAPAVADNMKAEAVASSAPEAPEVPF